VGSSGPCHCAGLFHTGGNDSYRDTRAGRDPIQWGSFMEGLAEAPGDRAFVGKAELSLQPLRVRLGLRIQLTENRLAGEMLTEFIIYIFMGAFTGK